MTPWILTSLEKIDVLNGGVLLCPRGALNHDVTVVAVVAVVKQVV